MKYQYDTARMKSCAESVEKEIKNFETAKKQVDSIVQKLSSTSWKDETNQRFVQLYNKEAKTAAEDLDEMVGKFASFLKQCAKKYSDAIDNGNSYLSS